MSDAELNKKLNSVPETMRKLINEHGELHLNAELTEALFLYIEAQTAAFLEFGHGLKKIQEMGNALETHE